MAQLRGAFSGRGGTLALLVVLAVHLILCLVARPGFLASDDMFYAQYADRLAAGNLQLDRNHFANRLGLIAPTALSYSLLGVDEVSSVIWPLLCSLGTIVLVYSAARALAGGAAGVLAAVLVAWNPAQVSSSLLLLPDGPTGTLLFAAAFTLLAARRAQGVARFGLAALVAALVTAAFFTKMTAVWIVPFLVVLGLSDLLGRRHRDLWAASLSLLVLAGILYLLLYRHWTGDPFYRLNVIEAGHNLSRWSYSDRGSGALFNRLTWEPILMILGRPGLAIPLLLAIPATLASLRRGAGDRGRYSILFLSLLGSFWLLPTSLAAWNPLPLIPRMLLPVLPVSAILAAWVLVEIRFSVRLALSAGALLALAGAAALPLVGPERGAIYLATAGLVASIRLLSHRTLLPVRLLPFAAAAPVALLAVYAVARGGAGETKVQAAERRILTRHLDPRVSATVFTDTRSASAIRFRLGYPSPSEIVFWTHLDDAVPDPQPARPGVLCYAYVNDERIAALRSRGKPYPPVRDFATRRNWDVVASMNGVTLYRRR